MLGRSRSGALPVVFSLLFALLGTAGRSSDAETPEKSSKQRSPWTTSRIQGSPEPAHPYLTQRVFPALKFEGCLDLQAAPGTDRLFVVEQGGKIFSFRPMPEPQRADLVVDLAKQIPGVQQAYALAFHPDFKNNRFCYVCYIKAPDVEDGTHVSRFRISDTDPPVLDPRSETPILTWLSGGHNGCCLKFGPDGYLYISTGDGGPANPPDPKRTGQDLGDLLSSILRIDVDHTEGSRNYRIPPDNPYVATKGARGEIWAYGLRNPWRMSFDQKTGDLWVGDVGWERWEMLNRIERGGNYGWAVMEGLHSTHPEWTRGPTTILPPTIEHPHSESSSITDGLTYYGDRLKPLKGTHLYGDYDTGKIWGFRFEKGKVVDHRELADTTHRIVSFGERRDGEFYLLDHSEGTLHQLIPNTSTTSGSPFPRKLSETGLFSDATALTPAPGVLSYSIKLQPWEDGARTVRHVAIPGLGRIKTDSPAWIWPKDSVLAKTLSIESEASNPDRLRRVETQLLHFDGLDWQPYSYRWNEAQTDADLVGPAGAERTLEVLDRSTKSGRTTRNWHYSGRAECQRCHNRWAGPVLGFNAPQLDHSIAETGSARTQLASLQELELIGQLAPEKQGHPLADPTDQSASLETRARSYLHVNCSHCHRMHAGSAVLSKMNLDLPLDQTDMVGVRPTQGTFGIHNGRVIAPGDPSRSILIYRMAKMGSGRMPYIGSSDVDRSGVQLLSDWIRQMPDPQRAANAATSQRLAETSDTASLEANPDAAEAAKQIDRLLASTSGALRLLERIDLGKLKGSTAQSAIQKGASHPDATIRDLFERFLPQEQRTRRLGTSINTNELLAKRGDSARGRQLFQAATAISCKSCHKVGSEGGDVGPELTHIARKYTRSQLLESIVEPSRIIEPQYVRYLVETKDGRVLTGLVVERTADHLLLKDAQNKSTRIPTSEIDQCVPSQQSLMPELLLRDLTVEQVADLLEFLESLK